MKNHMERKNRTKQFGPLSGLTFLSFHFPKRKTRFFRPPLDSGGRLFLSSLQLCYAFDSFLLPAMSRINISAAPMNRFFLTEILCLYNA